MRSQPRFWLSLCAAFCLIFAHHASSSGENREVLRWTFSPADVRLDDGPQGPRLRVQGLRSLYAPDSPAIPFTPVLVEAPPGMQAGQVRVRAAHWAPVPLSSINQISLKALPAEVAAHAGGGWSRGRRLEAVHLHPLRWDGNTLEIPGEVEVEIQWEPVSGDQAVVVPRATPWEGDNRFATLGIRTRNKAVLPPLNRVSGNAPFDPGFLPSLDGSPVRYLIITSDAMAGSFQRLADRKTALGMPAQVRSVSWIETHYPHGVDAAQNIRNFITAAVEQWGVEFVLLGGDIDVVPIREVRTTFFGGEDIPTDMYYSCLDGNYNASGNTVFGEAGFFENDSADLYPDVWVGRTTTRDSVEAAVFVSKLETYETSLELAGTFPDSFLVLAEMLEPQNWNVGDPVYFDGALLAEEAVSRVGVNVTSKRYYENYVDYPGTVQLTKSAAKAEIGVGFNLVLHVGHGYRNTMAMGLNGETIANIDADLFKNGDRQGLLYAINCTSSALDYDCIAEHFLRNRFGGFCGVIGSTRWDFPGTGRNYQNEFFDLLYQDGVTRIGEAAGLQKIPFIGMSGYDSEHRWTQFSLIYLGDPDLDLHTDELDSLVVSVLTPLELGVENVDILVTDSLGPVDSTVVTLYKEGDAYASGLTDATGMVTLPFAPDLEGGMTVGARKHNHWTRLDSLTVLPSAGNEHLFLASLNLDDSAGGDGDGRPEAGETVLLYPQVTNSGTGTATTAAVTVTGLPAGITSGDPSSSLGTVAPGSTIVAGDPIELVIDGTVPDLTVMSLVFEFTADAYIRHQNVPFYVGGPGAVIYATALWDTVGNGNGNGTVEPGEDVQMLVTLTNLGLGASQGLTATLTSSDPQVIIGDGACAYGDLEAGSSSSGDGFQFSITDGDLTRPMTLTVNDQSGLVLSRLLDLAAPSQPTGVFAVGKANSIRLGWDPSPDVDTFGYVVYRSLTPGGPYTRMTPYPTDPISIYDDADLLPLTRYYYRVAALDSSGVEGPWSGESAATTSLPPHAGYPLLMGTSTGGTPCLGYYNGDVLPELVAGGDQIYITVHDGSEWIDGDNNVQTQGVFSSVSTGTFWAPPSTADMDQDGYPEIACATWGGGYLYLWDSYGNVKPGFPKLLNVSPDEVNVWSAASMADVDNDGDMELFINVHNKTFAFHHDGTELIDGDSDPGTNGVFLDLGSSFNYSTPSLSDVDNDGYREIIITTRAGMLHVMRADGTSLPNFPWNVGGEITNSAVTADLDKDGLKEIIFASSLYQAYAVDINLNQPPGWPVGVNMNQDLDASPALADFTGDGYLEVVLIGGNGTPYIYQGKNGAALPGWGGMVLYDTNGSKVQLTGTPAIGNLDTDPDLEVCFGGGDGNLYAFNTDLSPVTGFPIGTPNSINRGAVLWDIDGDGLTEVIAQSFDERLYVWDSPGAFDPDNQPWPLFGGNSRRTGDFGDELWTYVGTGDLTAPRLVLGPNVPNPFRSRTQIQVTVPSAQGMSGARLAVYDVQGRLVRMLHEGALHAGRSTFTWDGLGGEGSRVGAGVYFYRLETPSRVQTRKMVLLP